MESESVESKRPRSASYPGISLEKVIDATRTLYTKLGNGPYSREVASKALGYAGVSGASSIKIAACVHFGLLDRKLNTYSQSILASRIINNVSEEEKDLATKEAFGKPTLYAKLISAYNNKSLPLMLDNILIRDYDIQRGASKEAAETFRKSAGYAKVLVNGILNYQCEDEKSSEESAEANNNIETANKTMMPSVDIDKPPSSEAVLDGSIVIAIPESQIKVVFPHTMAYELSIGTYKDAIEQFGKKVSDREEGYNASAQIAE